MLRGLSGQDLINQNRIQQQSDVEKVLSAKKNPYANVDKNLLIDETSISNEALNMYQKDLDIKKFTALAMSNPDDYSHNALVAANVFSFQNDDFENMLIEGIFNNKTFLRDLFG